MLQSIMSWFQAPPTEKAPDDPPGPIGTWSTADMAAALATGDVTVLHRKSFPHFMQRLQKQPYELCCHWDALPAVEGGLLSYLSTLMLLHPGSAGVHYLSLRLLFAVLPSASPAQLSTIAAPVMKALFNFGNPRQAGTTANQGTFVRNDSSRGFLDYLTGSGGSDNTARLLWAELARRSLVDANPATARMAAAGGGKKAVPSTQDAVVDAQLAPHVLDEIHLMATAILCKISFSVCLPPEIANHCAQQFLAVHRGLRGDQHEKGPATTLSAEAISMKNYVSKRNREMSLMLAGMAPLALEGLRGAALRFKPCGDLLYADDDGGEADHESSRLFRRVSALPSRRLLFDAHASLWSALLVAVGGHMPVAHFEDAGAVASDILLNRAVEAPQAGVAGHAHLTATGGSTVSVLSTTMASEERGFSRSHFYFGVQTCTHAAMLLEEGFRASWLPPADEHVTALCTAFYAHHHMPSGAAPDVHSTTDPEHHGGSAGQRSSDAYGTFRGGSVPTTHRTDSTAAADPSGTSSRRGAHKAPAHLFEALVSAMRFLVLTVNPTVESFGPALEVLRVLLDSRVVQLRAMAQRQLETTAGTAGVAGGEDRGGYNLGSDSNLVIRLARHCVVLVELSHRTLAEWIPAAERWTAATDRHVAGRGRALLADVVQLYLHHVVPYHWSLQEFLESFWLTAHASVGRSTAETDAISALLTRLYHLSGHLVVPMTTALLQRYAVLGPTDGNVSGGDGSAAVLGLPHVLSFTELVTPFLSQLVNLETLVQTLLTAPLTHPSVCALVAVRAADATTATVPGAARPHGVVVGIHEARIMTLLSAIAEKPHHLQWVARSEKPSKHADTASSTVSSLVAAVASIGASSEGRMPAWLGPDAETKKPVAVLLFRSVVSTVALLQTWLMGRAAEGSSAIIPPQCPQAPRVVNEMVFLALESLLDPKVHGAFDLSATAILEAAVADQHVNPPATPGHPPPSRLILQTPRYDLRGLSLKHLRHVARAHHDHCGYVFDDPLPRRLEDLLAPSVHFFLQRLDISFATACSPSERRLLKTIFLALQMRRRLPTAIIRHIVLFCPLLHAHAPITSARDLLIRIHKQSH